MKVIVENIMISKVIVENIVVSKVIVPRRYHCDRSLTLCLTINSSTVIDDIHEHTTAEYSNCYRRFMYGTKDWHPYSRYIVVIVSLNAYK